MSVEKLDPHDLSSIKIIEHKYLPPNTVLVSSDIAKMLREKCTAEGRDRAFLKDMGIAAEPEGEVI